MNEADTCRKFVVPKLQAAGWENDPHPLTEQKSFTGRRASLSAAARRGAGADRAGYLLRYTRDFPIVVVGAKVAHKSPNDWLQEAKDFRTSLASNFAYATTGSAG